MADDHSGRKAGSPSASGDSASNPGSQPKPDANPSPAEGNDAEGKLSEEDVKSILTDFADGNLNEEEEEDDGGKPKPEPKPNEQDDPGEDDEDDDDDPDDGIVDGEGDEDDSDIFDDDDDDDPDRSGSADDDDEGEGEPSDDDDEENAEELDDVQSKLDDKSGKAFARMRVQLKKARKDLKTLKATAAFGDRMGQMIDRFQISDEQLYQGLLLVSTLNNDPIKGLSLLREAMAQTAGAARERYPGANLDELLTFTPDSVGEAAEVTLPEDLQEMVDEGRISEERAKEIALAMKRGEEDEGTDKPDIRATPEQIEETNNALRAIGFYKVKTDVELEQRIEMLIPAMERLAAKLGLDMNSMGHGARKELAVRAGRAVLKHLNKKGTKSKSKKGRMLRSRDGGKPREQTGDHKTWGDVERAVAAGFSPS